jgi:hypothetical protein
MPSRMPTRIGDVHPATRPSPRPLRSRPPSLAPARSTSTVKGLASDLFAQLVVEKKRVPEWRRTLAFTIFGATYLGAWAQYKYSTLFVTLFGASKGAGVILLKIMSDMLVSGPLIYFPIYFAFKGALTGGSTRKGLGEYFSAKGFGLLRRYWVVWTPTLLAMWWLVPSHLQCSFVCAVSLLWQVVLSTLSYVPSKAAVAPAPSLESPDDDADRAAYPSHFRAAPHDDRAADLLPSSNGGMERWRVSSREWNDLRSRELVMWEESLEDDVDDDEPCPIPC